LKKGWLPELHFMLLAKPAKETGSWLKGAARAVAGRAQQRPNKATAYLISSTGKPKLASRYQCGRARK
jgi:hypothetical protein